MLLLLRFAATAAAFTAAVAALYWLASHEECAVITTAPTLNQVVKLLWAEIHHLVGKSRFPFPKPTTSQLTINSKRYALGFTTSVEHGDQGVKFQGFHSKSVLVILDEAPGVDGRIWEALEGMLASGDVHVLALGNPTIASGPFFDAFGMNRSQWKTHTISALDIPNFKGVKITYMETDAAGREKEVVLGDPNGIELKDMTDADLAYQPTPYLCSRRWVRDRYLEWGPTSPLFQSRCLGNFAAQAPDALVSLSWLEQAKYRAYNPAASSAAPHRLRAGIDVAGPGEDETVLCIRVGAHIVSLKSWPNADPRGEIVYALREAEAWYRAELVKRGINDEDALNMLCKFETVNVDSCGVGYYLARHLEDQGFPVSDINVGEAPNDPLRYYLLKAECYWGLRLFFSDGAVSGLTDELAISQLAGIRYKPNSRGQIVIESKEDARKRGVKSPDRAEAIMLAFANSRTHGLFEFWASKAQEIKLKKAQGAEPNTNARDLAESQAHSAWQQGTLPDKMNPQQRTTTPKGRSQTATSTKAPVCPRCGSQYLNLLADGAWRCNPCGISGVKDQIYNAEGRLVSA